MSLTQDLQNLQSQFRANVPEEAKAIMDRATKDLVQSGIIDRSLKQGSQVPNFTLPNAVGKSVELRELLKGGSSGDFLLPRTVVSLLQPGVTDTTAIFT